MNTAEILEIMYEEWELNTAERASIDKAEIPFEEFLTNMALGGAMNKEQHDKCLTAYNEMQASIDDAPTELEEPTEEEATPTSAPTTTDGKKEIEKELRAFVQEHFCIIRDEILVLSADTNQWAPYKRTDAVNLFYQDYGDVAEEFAKRLAKYADELLSGSKKDAELDTTNSDIALALGRDTVKRIFNNSTKIVQAPVWYPGEELYCEFDGSARINTFVDNRPLGIVQKEDVSTESYAKMAGFLAHLTGHDPKDGVALMEDGESTTAWVAQWLAHAWQHPEEQPNTMLWLLSETKGIGKGTIWWFINQAFGQAMTSEITQAEMESDKNGRMSETLFVQFDEADAFHKATVSKRLYTLLGNEYINIRKLYQNSYRSPNRIRWVGTTNELSPIILEAGCRRHTLIRCREGDEAKEYARDFWKGMREDDVLKNEMIEAFIYIIENMKYNFEFINTPLETETRDQLLEVSKPLIERWFESYSTQWNIDDFVGSGQLYAHFKRWAAAGNEKNLTRKWFYNSLPKLSRWLERPDGGKFRGMRGYWKRLDHPQGPYIELSDRMTNLKDHRAAKDNGLSPWEEEQQEIEDEFAND